MKSAYDLVLLAKSEIQEIGLDLADEEIKSSCVVLDVREPDEFSAGHILGSINVPRGLLEFKMSATESLAPRDLKLIVYCKNGGR
jgi:rhodanese-related sulfurtransferase